jgi:glycosyltransferase involved in cell wall biosynthesis
LSTVDPSDQGSWSGITFQMFRTLRQDHEVKWSGPVVFSKRASFMYRFWNNVNRMLNSKFTSHNYLNAVFSAQSIRPKIKDEDFDYIVIGAGEPELFAYLDTTLPVIYIADTTFGRMVDYYPWHTGLCRSALRQGNEIEKRAIDKAIHLLYSSGWAAASAIENYGADPKKVTVAPFGPSLIHVPSRSEILNKARSAKCRLLFIGADWERKGGKIAVDTYYLLKRSGLDCSLTIVGGDPGLLAEDDCMVIPFLDKNDPEQMMKFYNIFLGADILISPSRADCTPVTFSEAAAFGIPVFTTDTGGISSIIINGKNGFCLPCDAAPEEFCASIRKLWLSAEDFRNLNLSARNEYDTRLCWEKWKEKFNTAIFSAGNK